MRRLNLLLAGVLTLTLCASAASAQQVFVREGVEYQLELPSNVWRATSSPDSVHQHMEFVNGDRMDGYLRIRKELVDAGTTASDIAKRDMNVKLRFAPGFVEGREERFSGKLGGVTTTYEFTTAGKPMAGRLYYLQADNRTVYILWFTGQRDKLLRLRNQTDSIARSFQLK
ncbi:MAG TPA: hypothetical protein VER08_06385 [Pyrinomonadaceae bacterium]|nr:hypothetical protein [Pyrinomonadaceae bacterium]